MPSPADGLATVWILDLDGTLLGTDGALHPHTVHVLTRAHDAGIHVVIATGRILAATLPVLAALPFTPWVICCGGQTLLPPGGSASVTQVIDPAHVADAVGRALPLTDVCIQLYTADRQAHWRPNAASDHLATSEQIVFETLAALPEPVPTDLVKVVFVGEPEALAVLDARMPSDLPYAYTVTGPRYRDVLPRGVDKGTAIDRLFAATGWARDRILAAGDNQNDLPTFARAWHRVAVAGRCPPLVAQAHEVVGHHDDAGVARVLQRWLP